MVLDDLRGGAVKTSWASNSRVQTQCKPDAFLCMIADRSAMYDQQQRDAEQLCMELERRISEWLSGVERRVIRSHYLYNQTFEQIAVAESYSYRHIMRVHWRALAEYGRRLTDDGTSCHI